MACPLVNGFLSFLVFTYVFIHFLVVSGCEEGMAVWIKVDQILFFMSGLNMFFNFITNMKKKEDADNEKLAIAAQLNEPLVGESEENQVVEGEAVNNENTEG